VAVLADVRRPGAAEGAGIAANRLETLQHADTAWVPIALGAILVDIAASAPAEQKRNVAKAIGQSICGRRMKVVRTSFPLKDLIGLKSVLEQHRSLDGGQAGSEMNNE